MTLALTTGLLAFAEPAGADVASPRDPALGLHLTQPNSAADANIYNGHADFSAAPEMDANANAFFRPEVDDEVLAYINYEPDLYW